MYYILPALSLSVVSLIVLFLSKKNFRSPNEHFLSHPGEGAILASNVSSAFTATTFWVLFIFGIKSWSIPSFLALQGGVLSAYLLYGILVWKEVKHKTFLNLIFGDNPPYAIRKCFFGLALLGVLVELGLGRSFIETILIDNHQPAWIASVSITVLGAATILYTYSGGMYAVVATDAVFMAFCVLILVVALFFLGRVPALEGLNADLKFYEFSRLSILDYIFYFSAGLYVFLMFLFHPDHWYRNLRLAYSSKSKRLWTIGLSGVLTSGLLQIAYFIAVASRTSTDKAFLYENLIHKSYDIHSVISVVEPAFQLLFGPIVLVFLVLISAFTTVSSLIISSVAGYYETAHQGGPEAYKNILLEGFKITVVLTILALTFDMTSGILGALLIASVQLTLTLAILTGRAISLPANSFWSAIKLGVTLWAALTILNWIQGWYFYYTFLAMVSAIIAPISVWWYRKMFGGVGNEQTFGE